MSTLQIHKKKVTIFNNIKLNPNFLSGFTDAEGCFHVSIVNKPELRVGKSVRTMFSISLHERDLALLIKIK